MKEIDYRIPCWYICNKEGMGYPENYDCRKVCSRFMHMNLFIQNCGKPNAENFFIGLVPNAKDEVAFDKLMNIRENIEEFVSKGKNLHIHSKVIQNGKTTWAVKLMYRYFDRIWNGSDFIPRGYCLDVPKFISNLKNYEYRNTKEFKELDGLLRGVDLVIWDDFNTPLNTQEQNILQNYISNRFTGKKANIFTSFDDGCMAENIGTRLNMYLNMCEDVEFLASRGDE